MGRTWKLIIIISLLLAIVAALLVLRKRIKTNTAAPGETVELIFELDKKFEFGEYYFDLGNGKSATYQLCYCLTEKNTYPPNCIGDVKYIYNNTPGTMCVPLNIGTGRCSAKVMSSSGHETMFIIPLEYRWTKPVEKIVMGIQVPGQVPDGARLVIEVTLMKRTENGKLVRYRKYEQAVVVKQNK